MKVLFLDHQGVMYIKKHPNPGILDLFDEAKVALLNTLDTEIVVSSDWRLWVPYEQMKTFYTCQGIKAPIDYTTHKRSTNLKGTIAFMRACEINNWLAMHKVTHWVAIDDLDMTSYLTNFVRTDPAVGLTVEKLEEILNYLSD